MRGEREARALAWLIKGVLAGAFVGGILLIDDATAQTAYLVIFAAVVVGGDAILSRRRSASPGGTHADEPDEDFPWLPLAGAVLVASLVFESDDATFVAVTPLGLAFVVLWKLARRRRRGGAAHV